MTGTIRTLIVDDEPLAVKGLRALLAADPDLQCDECGGGRAAIRMLQEQKYDLVFLDVQMPRVDGFAVVREVGLARMPLIVFTTAFSQHAIGAFDARAIDYLLKPFSQARLEESVRRAKAELRRRRVEESETAATETPAQRAAPERLSRLVLRTGNVTYTLDLANVSCIEADGYYARLWTGTRSHLARQSLNALEATLDPTEFVRAHRGAIVRLRDVLQIRRLRAGRYCAVLKNGMTVKVSRDRRGRLETGIADCGENIPGSAGPKGLDGIDPRRAARGQK